MGHHHAELKNPGFLAKSSSRTLALIAAFVVGAGLLGLTFVQSPKLAYAAILQNHFFFMSLALGGLFISAIQFLTSAMWSAPVRRIAESFSAYLPFVLLGFIAIGVGIPALYIWSHPEVVSGNLVLEHKSGYLSVPFFVIRNCIAIGLWVWLGKVIVGRSLAQDKTGDVQLTLKNKALAPAFLMIFALSYSMASFDQLMSLDPMWFSTMFGVYCFAGLFSSALALTAIFAVALRKQGILAAFVNDNHFHDLGKFMFAFSIFWAYIAFSQFMLIWYANMPEETGYFMLRFEPQWMKLTLSVFCLKFLFPFFALLPRAAKRNGKRLVIVGSVMIFAQWLDLMWLVQPSIFPGEGPRFLGAAGALLVFGALFFWAVFRFLERNTVVAIHDPKLAESVFEHQQ